MTEENDIFIPSILYFNALGSLKNSTEITPKFIKASFKSSLLVIFPFIKQIYNKFVEDQ